MMTTLTPASSLPRGSEPVTAGRRSPVEHVLVMAFMVLPLLAVAAAVPVAWGWGLGWADVAIGVALYAVSGLGITIGYHRHFTHSSFKARRGLRIALAVAGSLAMQGGVISWVADHRRHHAFSDKQGDPHSPWLHGTGGTGLIKGFWHSHMGWLLDREQTNARRYAPDLLADPDLRRISDNFLWFAAAGVVLPGLLGGLLTWSWAGVLSGLFWAGLVRIALLHHATWSINSICHIWGDRPFAARDRSANVWWLAIASFGESWHNLHHADPTCARHGVRRGQIDISARLIGLFEKLGWAHSVRWPTARRLERLTRRP